MSNDTQGTSDNVPAHHAQAPDSQELAEAKAEIARLRERLEAVQTDLDGALDTMEWQRREIGRLHVEIAKREDT